MPSTTTIMVFKSSKKELDGFKTHPRESYAQVVKKLVKTAKEADESKFELSDETWKAIHEAERDYKKGRFLTTTQLKQKLGL